MEITLFMIHKVTVSLFLTNEHIALCCEHLPHSFSQSWYTANMTTTTNTLFRNNKCIQCLKCIKNISMYEYLSRTGLLGFLSDETKSLPGNLGLADLDWVQQAIADFRGNPNYVTLASWGQGAGMVRQREIMFFSCERRSSISYNLALCMCLCEMANIEIHLSAFRFQLF